MELGKFVFVWGHESEHFLRHSVVSGVPGGALDPQVFQRIEFELPVESVLVGAMAPFDLPVVLRRPRPYEMVLDFVLPAEPVEVAFLRVPFGFPRLVGEFEAIVRLDLLGQASEGSARRLQGHDGFVHGMLFGEVKDPFPGAFVEDRVLVEFAVEPGGFAFLRDVFDVHLPLLVDRFRGVVFLVVPLPARLVRHVLASPSHYPKDRASGDAGSAGPHPRPYLAEGGIGVPPAEGEDPGLGSGVDPGWVRRFRAVAPIHEAFLGAVVPFEPSVKRRPLHVVIGKDLPDGPSGIDPPPHRVQPRLKIEGRVVPLGW